LPLWLGKTNLARVLARRPDGIFVASFEAGEIGPDLFREGAGRCPDSVDVKKREPSGYEPSGDKVAFGLD
jgi:bifunctional non-homologous end joining protein LigD